MRKSEKPGASGDWRVDPYEETTAPLPDDLLRPIPKQDNETHVTYKLITKHMMPTGFWIQVRGTF